MARQNYKSASDNLVNYNAYSDEYVTGTSINLFIGPIWVEEVVSLQLFTKSDKAPVYNYASEFYDRALKGNYLIQGSLGIAYTEAEYLSMILHESKYEDMTNMELTKLLTERKSKFAHTLTDRLVTSKLGENIDNNFISENLYLRRAYDYVERISNEIELLSLDQDANTTVRNPYKFKLMVVYGNMNDPDAGIDIYEDVEIVSTGKTIANDDQPAIVLYDIIGRKMPDRIEEYTEPPSKFLFDRQNLMEVILDLSRQLCTHMVEDPILSVCDTTTRTSLVQKASQIAYSGFLPNNGRGYGEKVNLIELIYSIKYPLQFTHKDEDGKEVGIRNTVPVYIRNMKTSKLEVMASDENKEGGQLKLDSLDNDHGKLISPDRQICSDYICAIGAIEPVKTTELLRGSIVLPRTIEKEYDIGEQVPPKIIDINSVQKYEEDLIPNFTKSALWLEPLGFRTSSSISTNKPTTYGKHENEDSDLSIKDLTQPITSVAYVENIGCYYYNDNGNKVYGVLIDEPRYIDFVKVKDTVNNPDTYSNPELNPLKTSIMLPFSEQTHIISKHYYNGAEDGSVSIDGPLGEVYEDLNIDSESNLKLYESETKSNQSFYTKVLKYENSLNDYNFTNITNSLESLSRDENSALDIAGIVYDKAEGDEPVNNTLNFKPTIEISKEKHIIDMTKEEANVFRFELNTKIQAPEIATNIYRCMYVKPTVIIKKTGMFEDYDKSMSAEESLCYMLYEMGNCDDYCDTNFKYDWTITDKTGYYDPNQDLTIEGAYFITLEDGLSEFVDDNQEVEVYVYWTYGILPVKTANLDEMRKISRDEVSLSHDLDKAAGRQVDIYNITRVDGYQYNMSIFLKERGFSAAFKEYMSAFTGIDNTDKGYVLPIHVLYDKLAAFMNGFGSRINKTNLVNSILDMQFNVNTDMMIKDDIKDIRSALKSTVDIDNGDDPIGEATGIILEELRLAITNKGFIIVDDSDTNPVMTVKSETVNPMSEIVAWGLTENGYEELHNPASYYQDRSPNKGPEIFKLENYDV